MGLMMGLSGDGANQAYGLERSNGVPRLPLIRWCVPCKVFGAVGRGMPSLLGSTWQQLCARHS